MHKGFQACNLSTSWGGFFFPSYSQFKWHRVSFWLLTPSDFMPGATSPFQAPQSSSDVLSDHILSRPRYHPLKSTPPSAENQLSAPSMLLLTWSSHHYTLCPSWLPYKTCAHCLLACLVYNEQILAQCTFIQYQLPSFGSTYSLLPINCKRITGASKRRVLEKLAHRFSFSFIPKSQIGAYCNSFSVHILLSKSVFLSVQQLLCLSGRGWAMNQVNVSTEGSHMLGRKTAISTVCASKRSEGNLRESVLLHLVDSGNWTQVMRLGGMHLYLLSHLAGPEFAKDLKHKSQLSRWLNTALLFTFLSQERLQWNKDICIKPEVSEWVGEGTIQGRDSGRLQVLVEGSCSLVAADRTTFKEHYYQGGALSERLN